MTKKETIKDGVVETFYKNGQLESRGNYKDGKQDGLWETFLSNNNPLILHGHLQSRGNYKNDEEDGLWEEFDRDGNLTSTKTWENGVLIETNDNP